MISIHALREEGDVSFPVRYSSFLNFYPRPPRGGRPPAPGTSRTKRPDFYPRPPRGGRQSRRAGKTATDRFLSTPSARRATTFTIQYSQILGFLSTPSARRATSYPYTGAFPESDFYPRPPRGGRLAAWSTLKVSPDFYPRPPRGGRLLFISSFVPLLLFLSTPSARRATGLVLLL